MQEMLFQKSFYQVWQYQLRAAVEDVGKLRRDVFKSPALQTELQRIVQKYEIEIAALEGEVTARRRSEERERADSWGDVRRVKMTWLDVSIPFKGEAETLRVAPSSSTLIFERVTVGRAELTISVSDDDRADNAVNQFKQQVTSNLDTLRREYETARPQLEQAVQQAASQRKAQIDTEDARDGSRSFRVTN